MIFELKWEPEFIGVAEGVRRYAQFHRPGSSGTQFRNFSLTFTCLGSWGAPPYI
jgi:hypothetical protein